MRNKSGYDEIPILRRRLAIRHELRDIDWRVEDRSGNSDPLRQTPSHLPAIRQDHIRPAVGAAIKPAERGERRVESARHQSFNPGRAEVVGIAVKKPGRAVAIDNEGLTRLRLDLMSPRARIGDNDIVVIESPPDVAHCHRKQRQCCPVMLPKPANFPEPALVDVGMIDTRQVGGRIVERRESRCVGKDPLESGQDLLRSAELGQVVVHERDPDPHVSPPPLFHHALATIHRYVIMSTDMRCRCDSFVFMYRRESLYLRFPPSHTAIFEHV